jgi:Fe-S-cluster containining protein
MKKWDVFNMNDLYEMLHFISEKYGDDCSKCKTMCCANQMLEVQSEDTKAIAKHLKMDPIDFRLKYTKTKQNYMRDMDVKMMSDRVKSVMKAPGRVLMFVDSEDRIKIGKEESGAQYCPFYIKDTHRCNVHPVRPKACRDYPFQRQEDNVFEIRKVSDCIISDKFLERFVSFIAGLKGTEKLVEKMVEKVKADVASKTYYNHYYLPWMPVLAYIGWEFSKMGNEGIRLSMGILKRIEAEDRMMKHKMMKVNNARLRF